MTRVRDHTVAFAMSRAETRIHTTDLPNSNVFTVPDPTAARPRSTRAAGAMPAWSPDDLKLGFVRTASAAQARGVRRDAGHPGGDQHVVDIGPKAPTRRRARPRRVGGNSLADAPAAATPTPLCDPAAWPRCAARPAPRQCSGRTSRPCRASDLRRAGHRQRGSSAAPCRGWVVGRVPLGRARKGTNRVASNGKVDGKAPEAGPLPVTYGTLKGQRLLATSGSIAFRVTRSGDFRNVRRQR